MATWPPINRPPPETHTIVVVDDVPEIREILGFLLEESGWFRVVGEAGTAKSALSVAAATLPEAILLDVDLPDMSGWDLLPLLRRDVPSAAVVVLAGHGAEGDLPPEEAQAAASAVLQKGMPNRELITAILDVLGRTRLAAASRPRAIGGEPRRLAQADADAWFAAVVNSSRDAIVGKLLDGTIVSWNPAAEQLYGYEASEVIGRPVDLLVPADRPDEEPAILARLAAGEMVDSYETVRVHRDGTRIDVNLTIIPVVSADGQIRGATTVARDITSRRHSEAALARAISQLERRNRELLRSNEELDSFAAVASHDLAQPLQVAYGFLDMLRADHAASLPEQGRQWLDASLASLDRMRTLVRDILAYARTGSGAVPVEPTSLGGAVSVACDALAVPVGERGATVEVAVDPALRVIGDRGQLALVFQNLVANALKFVPDDRKPRVRVAAETSGADVLVRISDNGVGIPLDERSKVFDMFQRSSTSVREGFPGTGLGLAIVKKIVGRHGGSVWAEEASGGGTEVVVRLPAYLTTGA